MFNVGKIIDPDVLEEMTEECLGKNWASHQSATAARGDLQAEPTYDTDRTSKTLVCSYDMYPEFCQQLEEGIADGTKVNQLDLLVYEKGDKFVPHYDDLGDGHRHWSTSTILYLSEDYKGDGLKLYHEPHSKDHTIPRQEVGDTIIFKSKEVYHEAAPVEQGVRIVAVAWLGFE